MNLIHHHFTGLLECWGDYKWELHSVVNNVHRGTQAKMIEKLQYTVNYKVPALEEAKHAAVNVAQQALIERDRATALKQKAEGERDWAKLEREKAESERDRVSVEKREAEFERDWARMEKQHAQIEKDWMRIEKENETDRANELQQKLDELEGRHHKRSTVQEQDSKNATLSYLISPVFANKHTYVHIYNIYTMCKIIVVQTHMCTCWLTNDTSISQNLSQ